MRSALLVLFMIWASGCCALSTHVQTIKHAKMNLLVLTALQTTTEVDAIAKILQRDFSFSGQFKVVVQKGEKGLSKQIKRSAIQGFPLVVYIAPGKEEDSFEWRLYNAMQGSLIKGGHYYKQGTLLRGWAHALADIIWPEITAQPGFFSTKIVYCKQVERGNKHDYKHIYIADFDGTNEQLLVGTPTINVGPRFNKDVNQCLVFYSQFTRQNVEMRVADMRKRQRIVSTLDGINMQPAFSEDGRKVVYCASNGTGGCQIYTFENKKLTKITNNEGTNISPVFAHDGSSIYFCSDMHGRPSIYRFDSEPGSFEQITHDSFCMSPAYCPAKNMLAYCKKVNGVYQAYSYDCSQKKHVQLTHNDGHKSECSWSPCGNYLVYAVEKGEQHYLETLHLLNGMTQRLVTAGKCSYPSWSVCYKEFPNVTCSEPDNERCLAFSGKNG